MPIRSQCEDLQMGTNTVTRTLSRLAEVEGLLLIIYLFKFLEAKTKTKTKPSCECFCAYIHIPMSK